MKKMNPVFKLLLILIISNSFIGHSKNEEKTFFKENCKIVITNKTGKRSTTICEVILSSKYFGIYFKKKKGFDIGDGVKTRNMQFYFCGMKDIKVLDDGNFYQFKKGSYLYNFKSRNSKKIVEKLKHMMIVKQCEINADLLRLIDENNKNYKDMKF
ncbi:MAG: hypothetical protein ABFR75_04800 [Acidobacteriota bacterium]